MIITIIITIITITQAPATLRGPPLQLPPREPVLTYQYAYYNKTLKQENNNNNNDNNNKNISSSSSSNSHIFSPARPGSRASPAPPRAPIVLYYSISYYIIV